MTGPTITSAWSRETFPSNQTDSQFAGEISEADLKAITSAVEQVRAARDQAATEQPNLRTLVKKEGVVPSVYALSYAETGQQMVIAKAPMGNNAVVKKAALTTMAETFPSTQDVFS